MSHFPVPRPSPVEPAPRQPPRRAADPGAPADDRLALVAEALDGFVYEWDVERDQVARSAGLLEMLGFRADEATPDGAWWRSRIHPDDLAALLDATRALFADAAAGRARSEYRVQCRDGRWRWVADHARLVRDAGGRVVRVVGITTDVTAEHERRAALAAAQHAGRAARRDTERLQRLSADLTRVLTRAEVTQVVLRHLVDALAAHAGGVVELSDDGREFALLGSVGFDDSIRTRYAHFPVDAPLPVRDVAHTRAPVFLDDVAAWMARYPRAPVLPDGVDDAAWAALPLVVEQRLLGAITIILHGPRAIPDDERRFMRAFADQCAQALERARLFEAERDARAAAELAHQRVAFLAEVSERLARSRDVAATLRTVAELAVPALAEWCFVEVRDAAGDIRPIAIAHREPAMVALAHEVLRRYPIDPEAPFGTGHVLRTGAPELAPEISDEILQSVAQDAEHLAILRAVGLRSSLSVPLRDGDGPPIAVLSLASSDPARRFGAADLALAEEVARRADAALARARLFEAEHAARAEAEAARADAESARERATEANRAKSQFLATMSHELRTPLNAIGGYAELLELEVHGAVTEAQRSMLERIQRSQKHLLGLINEVLNYARIEAGTLRYDIQPVGVGGALATVESLILPQVQAKGLTLEIPACDASLQVLADAEKLRQVLLNLLSNAVKFTDRGGRVSVRCRAGAGDGMLVVTVTDTGVGIAPDQLERIFEPFVQVGRALNSPGEGTGLGLAISRDLVRAMGGDLTACSTPGVGSTFTLRLPAS